MNAINIDNIKQQILDYFDTSELEFREEDHKYYLDGRELTSVTTYLKQYTNEFNEYIIAANMAKGDEDYKNSLIKYWKYKREEATTRGNRIHLYAELYPNQPEPTCWYEHTIKEWMESLESKGYIILFQELKVYSADYCIAGTIDLVLYNVRTGKIILADWKTNSKSIYACYKNNHLRAPYEDMPDTSYSKYRLQLSVYKKLFELCGLEVENCWLLWLKADMSFEELSNKYNYKHDIAKIEVIDKKFDKIDIVCVDVELKKKKKTVIKTMKIGKRK